MDKKHIPLRKCSGCGKMHEKFGLIRVVRVAESSGEQVYIDKDFKKFGRGVYVCKNQDCLKACIKSRRFERSLKCKIDANIYEGIEEILKNE